MSAAVSFAARIVLVIIFLATLSMEAGATNGIGISPLERSVSISGAGNATAGFLLFNPSDREQQFAVHLPDSALRADPLTGRIEAGGMKKVVFTAFVAGTFEPRITMQGFNSDEMLSSGIQVKIIVRGTPAEEEQGNSLNSLTGMVAGVPVEKGKVGMLAALGLFPALLCGGIVWRRWKHGR